MRNSHRCQISSLSFTAGDWFSADYNHKEIEWLNPRAHNLSILESLLNPSPPSPSQLHNWLIFYPVLPSLNDFTGLPATSLVRFCNKSTYFKMLPGLSGKEPLHNLIARNNVRFPKAFFYRSRLCLSLGTLPDPCAYASGSSQKSSEVEILRVRVCPVPRPHYSVRPMSFRSHGSSMRISRFSRRLSAVPLGNATEMHWPRSPGKTSNRQDTLHVISFHSASRDQWQMGMRAVDHIDSYLKLPKVSSGSVKNMALVGLFNPAGSQTLFQ